MRGPGPFSVVTERVQGRAGLEPADLPRREAVPGLEFEGGGHRASRPRPGRAARARARPVRCHVPAVRALALDSFPVAGSAKTRGRMPCFFRLDLERLRFGPGEFESALRTPAASGCAGDRASPPLCGLSSRPEVGRRGSVVPIDRVPVRSHRNCHSRLFNALNVGVPEHPSARNQGGPRRPVQIVARHRCWLEEEFCRRDQASRGPPTRSRRPARGVQHRLQSLLSEFMV